jgi:hypothetical protein
MLRQEGCGQTTPSARRALIMQKFADGRIRHGGMGKQHLSRRKLAGIARIDPGPGAKERDLEPQILTRCRSDRPGHIPPFGAEIRVRAVVAR